MTGAPEQAPVGGTLPPSLLSQAGLAPSPAPQLGVSSPPAQPPAIDTSASFPGDMVGAGTTYEATPPVAPAAKPQPQNRIDMLRAGGFTDSEIDDWAESTRSKLSSAGFNAGEIADYFGAPTPAEVRQGALFGDDQGGGLVGPAWDAYAASDETPMGRIFKAMGTGASNNFGAESLEDGPLTELLSKLGVIHDYDKGVRDVFKMAQEASLRGAALVADLGIRTFNAAQGAVTAGLGQTAEELEKVPGIGPALAFPFGAAGELTEYPAVEFAGGFHPRDIPPEIAKARALGTVGDGNPTVEEAAASSVADDQQLGPIRYSMKYGGRMSKPETPPGQVTIESIEAQPLGEPFRPAEEPQDIHAIARSINPQAVDQYDALQTRRDTFARWANELSAQREGREAIDTRIGEIRDQMQSATKSGRADLAAELEGLQNQRETFAEQSARDRTIENLRQQMLDADNKMRDLLPERNAAYREAQGRMPPAPEEEAPVAEPESEPAQEAAVAQGEADEGPEHPPGDFSAPTQPPLPETETAPLQPRPTVASIHNDAYQKLTAAGRTPEQADAEAAIVDASYRARAAAFEGAKGTAEEMYAADNHGIVGSEKPTGPRGALGKTDIAADGKKTITLFENADPSTFVHEWGHLKLAELLSDAKDEAAPAGLKADAETVKNWLGVKEDTPSRSQHERFARAFERYLMEGVSPSQRLATVFGKFRQWLSDIYQTVSKKLAANGKPFLDEVNPKLKEVFDRMLSEPYEREIIAPEREDDLVEHQENLADTITPEEAPQVADQVRQTANQEVTNAIESTGTTATATQPFGTRTIPPWRRQPTSATERLGEAAQQPVSGRVTGERGMEAGGNASADQELGGYGAEGQPVAGATAPDQELGAIGSRGGETAEEGNPVPQRPKPTGQPDEQLPAGQSRFIDRAGNIRVDNLNAPDDVDAVIHEVADDNDEFRDYRGPVPDIEVKHFADAMGEDATEVNLKFLAEQYGLGKLAAIVRASRQLLVQSATKVKELAALAADGDDKAVLNFWQAHDRHVMIQQHLSGVTAEMGRSLRAFQDLAGVKDEALIIKALENSEQGMTLYQMRNRARQIQQLKTPEEISEFLKKNKPSIGDMSLEWVRSTIVSNIMTHLPYWVGNTLINNYRAFMLTPAAAAVGKIREVFGGAHPEGRVLLGEAGQEIKNMWTWSGGIPDADAAEFAGAFEGIRGGLASMWRSFRAGQTDALPGELVSKLTKPDRVAFDELVNNQGFTEEQALAKLGYTNQIDAPYFTGRAIPNFRPTIAGREVPIPVGSVVRAALERMVAPLHSGNRTIAFANSISAQAYRAAAEMGLSGDALNNEIVRLRRSPTPEMMDEARRSANDSALFGGGGPLTQAISLAVNKRYDLSYLGLGPTRVLAFAQPIIAMASRAIEEGIKTSTPFGLLAKSMREDFLGKNGKIRQDQAIAQFVLGSAIGAGAVDLYVNQFLTPSAPKDSREESIQQRVFGMPHSLSIGGWSFDLSHLGPIGLGMGIMADVAHLARTIGLANDWITQNPQRGDPQITELNDIWSLAVHSVASNFIDDGPLSGIADLFTAASDEAAGKRWLQNTLSSYLLPYSSGLGGIAKEIDPFQREAMTLLDRFKTKLPGESETLYPVFDTLGRPVPNKSFFGVYARQIESDPIDQAFVRLQYYPSRLSRQINNVALSDKQYNEYQIQYGIWAKQFLDQAMSLQGFDSLSDKDQRHLLIQAVDNAKRAAASVIKSDPANSRLLDAINAARTSGLLKKPAGGYQQEQDEGSEE